MLTGHNLEGQLARASTFDVQEDESAELDEDILSLGDVAMLTARNKQHKSSR